MEQVGDGGVPRCKRGWQRRGQRCNKCVTLQCHCRVRWCRGNTLDSRLREPGFECCAAVLKPWGSLFTLHCSSSLSCMNEYLALDSGGYLCE